jgi:peptidoglycan/LPS O-acetylase OafA/YrhL
MSAGGAVGKQPAADAYVAGIDTMRAVAVLSVLVYHLHASWLPGGFLGVDVFFAISGYVVASSLVRTSAGQTGWRLALGFYSRRLVRLYPALLLCLLSTFALTVLFVPSSWLSTTTWGTGLFAFAGLSNFALVWLAEPYFSPRAEFNPFTHTWSLAVEEQFYVVFPWLVAGWLAWRADGNARRPTVWLTLMLVLTLASVVFSAWASMYRPGLAFYMLPSRFWELAAGVWLARAHASGMGLSPQWKAGAAVAAVAGIVVVAVSLAFAPSVGFPWPGALAAVLGTLLCLQGLAAARALSQPLPWVEWPPVLYVGRISYSLYLWHWPVFVLMRWTAGLDDAWECGAALAVSLLLSALTHHTLENPLRLRFSRARPASVLGWGWGGVALLALVCLGLIQARPWLSQTRAMKEAADWYPLANAVDKLPVRDANAPQALSKLTLYVVGDSHAMAYAPMLARVEAITGWRVNVMAEAGCAVAKPATEMPGNCGVFLSDALDKVLERARAGDVVFLPGLRHARISDQWGAERLADVLTREAQPAVVQAREAAVARAKSWLAQARARNLRVMLEGPKPVFASPVFRCVDWFNRGNPVCSQGLSMPRATLAPLMAPAQGMLAALQGPGVSVWEPFDRLCPGEVCSAFGADGRPLFFDADHISRYANLLLVDDFIDSVRQASQSSAR